jgi:hypothetical protein
MNVCVCADFFLLFLLRKICLIGLLTTHTYLFLPFLKGLLALLDGSAWIRLGRRDVADYQAWVKAKALAVMRVGGGGGWMLTYPSLRRPLAPSQPRRSIRAIAPSSPGALRELACGCLHACAAYG